MKLRFGLKILGCLALIFLSATVGFGAASVPAPTEPLAEADALLKSPTLDMRQAERALTLYEGLLTSRRVPRPLLLAQLARACFIAGQLVPKKHSEVYFRKGQLYAEILIHEAPHQVAGPYWLALNLCGYADVGGYMLGRRLLPKIIEQLEKSLALDETFDQAGAYRVLGRIYYEAPAWPMSVGDLSKSLKYLQAAVRLAPGNSTNHLFLAQTLYRLNFRSLAEQQLEQVLKCTQYAIIPQDLKEDHAEAQRLLTEMKYDYPAQMEGIHSDLP